MTPQPDPASSSWFQSALGGLIYIDRPDPAAVDIEDIARALSRICRFGGHLRDEVDHYSVAQHSVWVSRICQPDHALLGLLHDAAEAYLGDMIRPLKKLLPAYKQLEQSWEGAIGERFGLGDALVNLPRDVKEADETMLNTERRYLLRPDGPAQVRWAKGPTTELPLTALSARTSRRLFLERFHDLRAGAIP